MIEVRRLHFRNTSWDISRKEFGNVIEVSRIHLQNAWSPMLSNPSGNVTNARSIHPWNALRPICVNVVGNIIHLRFSQLVKASLRTFVIPAGIVRDVTWEKCLVHHLSSAGGWRYRARAECVNDQLLVYMTGVIHVSLQTRFFAGCISLQINKQKMKYINIKTHIINNICVFYMCVHDTLSLCLFFSLFHIYLIRIQSVV